MVAMPPVPTPNNFLFLLEGALQENRSFAYRVNESSGKCFYIDYDATKIIFEVLSNFEDQDRSMLLLNVPEQMTLLIMLCLEINLVNKN